MTRTVPPADPNVLAVSPALGPLPPLLVTRRPAPRRVPRASAMAARRRARSGLLHPDRATA